MATGGVKKTSTEANRAHKHTDKIGFTLLTFSERPCVYVPVHVCLCAKSMHTCPCASGFICIPRAGCKRLHTYIDLLLTFRIQVREKRN